jgi:uncharacterized coiled-coil DUF342 family protein
MSKESLATTLHQWEHLLAASEANADELDYLRELREELQDLAEKARKLRGEQDALNARKQQVTRDLDAVKERGREVAVQVRMGIKTRYGFGGEKLIEFGLRPRKGKRPLPEGEPSSK